MNKIFISHAANDRDQARSLAQTLVSSGHSVFFDTVPVTADWASSIRKSLEEASTFVLLLSPNSISNANVNFELGVAAALHKPIIMVDTIGAADSILDSNWAGADVTVVDGSHSFAGVAKMIPAA